MDDEEIKLRAGEASDDASNQDEETDSDSLESLAELFGDDETSDEERKQAEQRFVDTFNKATGSTFKTVAAIVKSKKHADAAIAKAGTQSQKRTESTDGGENNQTTKKQDEEKSTVAPEVKIPFAVETIYFDTRPEAKLVWKEVTKAAKLTGRDPFELYETEDYFKDKARALYEEKHGEEENKGKVKDPSFQGGGKKGANGPRVTLSEADRALLRRRGLSEKDVKFN